MNDKIFVEDIVKHITLKHGYTLTHNHTVIKELFNQVNRHLNDNKSIDIPLFGIMFSKRCVRFGKEQTFFYITKHKKRQLRKRK